MKKIIDKKIRKRNRGKKRERERRIGKRKCTRGDKNLVIFDVALTSYDMLVVLRRKTCLNKTELSLKLLETSRESVSFKKIHPGKGP